MSTVMVVDDEGSGRRLIKQYLREYQDLELIGEAVNGLEAVEKINTLKPDVVFLDIQMPGLNGFEVLKHLMEIPAIVFSTAYDQYAIQAFEVHAVDYLLKPYTKDRFGMAIKKLFPIHEINSAGALAESILFEKQSFPERMLVNKNRKLVTILIQEITHIEAYGDYSKICCNGQTYISNKGISSFEETLPKDFIRVHRSYIINLPRVVSFQKEGKGYFAHMNGGETVKVSRGYANVIRNLRL